MRGIAETMYQIVKIIPRLPRTLPDVADSAAGVLRDTPQAPEHIPELESATTNCNRIGNNGAKYLADSLRNNTTLTTLDLTGNKIGRNGAQYLAGILRNNKTLLTLDMDSNYIQDHGAEQMASGLKHNKVTNFVLPSHIGLP
ncbi:unnamed protein product [Rotaria socialis]